MSASAGQARPRVSAVPTLGVPDKEQAFRRAASGWGGGSREQGVLVGAKGSKLQGGVGAGGELRVGRAALGDWPPVATVKCGHPLPPRPVPFCLWPPCKAPAPSLGLSLQTEALGAWSQLAPPKLR